MPYAIGTLTDGRAECRSALNAGYFNQAQSVALTVFGISAGVAMRFMHRYKWLLVAGLSIRLLCVVSSLLSASSVLSTED